VSATVLFLLTFGAAAAGAVAALGADAFGRRRTALGLSLAGTAVGAAVGVWAGARHMPTAEFGSLQVGGPSSMVFGVIALCGAIAIAGGWEELGERRSGGSIAALIALGVVAAGVTSSATDITTLLLAIETSAVCAYALVAAARTTRSAEASMKYFVQGSVATGLFVFGLAVLVGLFAPSGGYAVLGQAFTTSTLIMPMLAGVVLVLSALTFKVGGVPFHSWAPDVYETAPAESAAFLASGQKLAAIAAASVFVSLAYGGPLSSRVLTVVVVLAVLSVLVGSLAALRQTDYRRLLGYAGIAQAGYALIAVAVFAPPLAVFFGATYALAASGTFLAAAAFKAERPGWDGSVSGLAGLGREAPALCGSVGVLLISLAGLPPFLGFWPKLLVFGTALNVAARSASSAPQVSWTLVVGVTAGLVGSVVSLGYYGSILRSMFFDAPLSPGGACAASEVTATSVTGAQSAGKRRSRSAAVVVVALAVLIVALGLAHMALGSSVIFSLFGAQ
jgi:NADH-quinone oxidoreductase subunit N